MTVVVCPIDDCKYNANGSCFRHQIKLIVNRWDDIECGDYEEDVVRE